MMLCRRANKSNLFTLNSKYSQKLTEFNTFVELMTIFIYFVSPALRHSHQKAAAHFRVGGPALLHCCILGPGFPPGFKCRRPQQQVVLLRLPSGKTLLSFPKKAQPLPPPAHYLPNCVCTFSFACFLASRGN